MMAQHCHITSMEAMKTQPVGCVLFAARGTKTNKTSTYFSTMGTFTTERLNTFPLAQRCWFGMTKIIPCIWEFRWEFKWTRLTRPATHQQLRSVRRSLFHPRVCREANQLGS